MSEYVIHNGELYHHGVKGMKWGVRKAVKYRPASNGLRIGTRRQLKAAKKDLKFLDNGGHLSVGLTKKRQAAFDERDRKKLTEKINKLEKRKTSDVLMYGNKGADRIQKNMAEKGYSHKKAARRETARQVAIGVGVTAGLLLVSSGKAKQLASRGKSAATSLINSKTKATVIGKNGKVIRRYFTSRATDLGYGTTSLIPR